MNAALDLDIRLDQVQVEGIHSVDVEAAKKTGTVSKLIGSYENGAIRVRPERVPPDDIFSRINGTDKIVEFDSVEMGRLAVLGGASGRTQMGAAMAKEILNMYS